MTESKGRLLECVFTELKQKGYNNRRCVSKHCQELDPVMVWSTQVRIPPSLGVGVDSHQK